MLSDICTLAKLIVDNDLFNIKEIIINQCLRLKRTLIDNPEILSSLLDIYSKLSQ